MGRHTDYYVYVHIRESDGRVFYVGKGRGKRAWVSDRRSSYWQRTVAKHGLIVQIIVAGLNEACAFCVERMVIAKYGRKNLTNLTDGGEGTAGRVVTEEAKRHLRAINSGKFVSDETRRKISASTMGRKISKEHRESVARANSLRQSSDRHKEAVRKANATRQISDETRAKIGDALRDKNLYTLTHPDHGTKTAARSHFTKVYGMDGSNFLRVVRGQSRTCKGWRLPS